MAKRTITFQADRHDLRGLQHAMRQMDKEASNGLRDDVAGISRWSAGELQAASSQSPYPKQSAKVGATIRAARDRMPFVAVGGARGRFSGGAVSGNIVFGNEFGGPSLFPNGGRRFPYRSPRQGRGNAGYWIFPTLSRLQPEITRRWKAAVEARVIRTWSHG